MCPPKLSSSIAFSIFKGSNTMLWHWWKLRGTWRNRRSLIWINRGAPLRAGRESPTLLWFFTIKNANLQRNR
jgi:hypothetical protein